MKVETKHPADMESLLDERMMRLSAIGASIAANCQPCLEHNVSQALARGIGEQEIAEAIEVGKKVRQGAATKMDRFALSLSPATTISQSGVDGGCNCSS
jgi:AhpD family alkylhydroperoxidase